MEQPKVDPAGDLGRLQWLEPFALLALGLEGATLALATGAAPLELIAVGSVALMGLAGLAGLRGPAHVRVRSMLVMGITLGLIAGNEPTGLYLLWLPIVLATSALLAPPRTAVALIVAGALGYSGLLLLPGATAEAPAVVLGRSGLLAAGGSLVYAVRRAYVAALESGVAAQRRMLASEERFRLLVASVTDYAILMLDPGGYVVNWNEGAQRIKGYRAEEIIGQHFSRFYREEDARAGEPQLELEVAAEQGRFEEEGWRVRKDGSWFWASVVITAIRDRGELRGFAKVTRDISERRRAEQRAERLSRFGGALAETVTVADVVRVVMSQGITAIGAGRGVFAQFAEDRRTLDLRLEGYSDEVRERWETLALSFPSPLTDAVRERAPVYVRNRVELAARYPHLDELGARGGDEALAALPLIASGQVLGAWGIAWSTERPFPDEEHRFLATLAANAAQALERARLYEQQQTNARVLQRSLLPLHLPHVEDAQVVPRYRPGALAAEVGGDWYDVIALPGGGVGLSVGDVEGHSIRAAALMGQIRNAMRAYALAGHPPSRVMQSTNAFMAALELEELATCCYLQLEPEEGTATVVLAGHPPPLIISPDTPPRFVEVEPGLPLNVQEEAFYTEGTIILPPGASLVLFSDGLVEGPRVSLVEGLEQLLRAAAGAPSGDAGALADHLLERVGSPHHIDDIVLLALRYEPQRSPTSSALHVRRRLAPEPASVGAARRFTADMLVHWGSPDLTDTATLLVSELVTNAVRYAGADIDLMLALAPDRLHVEVIDESERVPTLGDIEVDDGEATSGRGLFIVEAMAAEWGISPHGAGKAVWFDLSR